MMARGRIFFRRMALLADGVTRSAKLAAVRLVAVAAGHAGCEHLALLERAVVVDLVAHLPVGLVEAARKRRDRVRVGEPASGDPILGKFSAARVTEAAGFDFLAQQRWREIALRVAARSIMAPDDPFALVEAHEQPLRRVLLLAERPPAVAALRPDDVL